MRISRRALLRRIGAGAAATAAVPSLAEASLGAVMGGRLPSGGAIGSARMIRLNRNESAYGPSANAIATMREAALNAANRYPDGEAEALRSTIGSLHSVSPEQVVLGCGSGEILRMAAEAFAGNRSKVIVALPTFELMGDCARRARAEVVAVPLTREYSHDLDAMLACSDATTGLVYVCNPNNPTGSLTRRQDLEAFLGRLPETAYLGLGRTRESRGLESAAPPHRPGWPGPASHARGQESRWRHRLARGRQHSCCA
jgi:histidinol-phosphate aminotransferase